MSDSSQYQHSGTEAGTEYCFADPDILVVIPPAGYRDTPQLARQCADFMNACAHKAGRELGAVVVMSNVLSQDAETRRVYQDLAGNGLYFGVVLVVDSALSRALASFFMGLSRPTIPTRLFGTVEQGIDWLRSIRPEPSQKAG